jgi:putative mycofactocin binding protein MftB
MMTWHANSCYTITEGTKYRYESFGGIVYQRAADKLHFVNSRLAVTLLFMAGRGPLREIAETISTQSPEISQEQILTILQRWEELGIIERS